MKQLFVWHNRRKSKMHTQQFLLTTIAILFFTGVDCKKDPVTPIDIKPGRRDYTWFVDTVNAGGNFINSIDGVSPNDVWAISIPGDFTQTFHHFDGSRWSTDSVYRPFSPQSVRVIVSNNVWSVGWEGHIWRCDKLSWKAQIKVTVENNYLISLESIDGDSPTDLYTTGAFFDNNDNLHALIFRFNGSTWSRIQTKDILSTLTKIRFFALNRALIHGLTHVPDGSAPDSSKIYFFDGTNVNEIYSGLDLPGEGGDFAKVSGGIIIKKGSSVVFFDGVAETKLFTFLEIGGIEARTIKDVFLGMRDGVAHYDGNDVQYLLKFADLNTQFAIIKAFPNCIFVKTFDRNKRVNLIYRGYLQ